jgi:hypothetical protein
LDGLCGFVAWLGVCLCAASGAWNGNQLSQSVLSFSLSPFLFFFRLAWQSFDIEMCKLVGRLVGSMKLSATVALSVI